MEKWILDLINRYCEVLVNDDVPVVNYHTLKGVACERLSETKQLTRGHNKSCRSDMGY